MRLGWLLILVGCIEEMPEADEAMVVLVDATLDAAVDAAPATEPLDMVVIEVAPPCIRVLPITLEIEEALIGRTTPRGVEVMSCGGQPLEVTRVYLAEGSSPTFTIEGEGFELPAFAEGEAPPNSSIPVLFTPEEAVAYDGLLVIESNDPARPRIEVPLIGRGTLNECPVAVAGQDTFNVLPLDIVALDGSASSDPDGPDQRPVRYTWTVIQRPAGSTAEPVERFQNPRDPANTGLPDDDETAVALFFVDLAGRYVIELTVEDNLGARAPSEGCPQTPAYIVIDAVPDEDIHVQLVWDTPGDPDQTDGDGSDVDLHLLHPRGRAWAQAPLDCFAANPNPDWGPAGAAGDCVLDLNDRNGAGPENINIAEPEDTASLGDQYCVGAEYHQADNFVAGGTWGPSEVTVRIFLGGIPAGEWSRVLMETNEFWIAACIIWTAEDQRTQVVNRYYPDIPRGEDP